MIKGLYSAVSGMMMNAAKQQVLSQNIANLNTPGFKQILATAEGFMQSQDVYSPQDASEVSGLTFLGQMGLGSQISQEYIDYTQGTLQGTGNSMDFAIQGGGFFKIKTPDGDRYTRDGRFLRDVNNNLVTVDGNKVLDKTGKEIKLPEGDITVAPDGTLSVNGTVATQLGIGVFTDPKTELKHTSGNLFTGPAASTSKEIPQVRQGFTEASNADPSQLMTQLVEVARSYEASQKLVQNQDELLGKAIASIGRLG